MEKINLLKSWLTLELYTVGSIFIAAAAILRFYDFPIHFYTRGLSPPPVLSLDKYVLVYED